jgi:hypothetical protein
MTYETKDINLVLTLSKNTGNAQAHPLLVTKILEQTEIIHYLAAVKLLRKMTHDEEFNFDLTGMEKKFDKILQELENKKEPGKVPHD